MGEERERKVIRLETRRVGRRVPGLGDAVFRAPAAADELRLARHYTAEAPDHRAFVNELIALTLETPAVDAARVDKLSERGRAICRVAVAEAAGCARDYRRLAGSGLTGDERLYRAMRAEHEHQLEKLRRVTGALTENVVRFGERARKALVDSGAIEQLAHNQRQFERLAEVSTRAFRPAHLEQMQKLSRSFDKLVRPGLAEQLTRPDSALNSVARAYTNIAGDLARQFEAVVRPSYFGALEQLSKQINDVVRPQHFESLQRTVEQMQRALIPRFFEGFARSVERMQEVLKPAYVTQFARVAEQLTRMPAIEQLCERLLTGFEAYAAWVERNWAQLYADPDNPPPVMFLLASLPMAVGLPLLRALKASDEPLLARLEQALAETAVVDALQQAVQQSPDLDPVAKRYLVRALESVREQRYVDAAPSLAWGLERAFKELARRRGIIDGNNKFLVATRGRKSRAKRVEDLFEPLGLDKLYLRFLRSWVFGGYGNLARHGDLPEPEHRRWVLRAVVALGRLVRVLRARHGANGCAGQAPRADRQRRGADGLTAHHPAVCGSAAVRAVGPGVVERKSRRRPRQARPRTSPSRGDPPTAEQSQRRRPSVRSRSRRRTLPV